MIDKKVARSILLLVNDPHMMDMLQEYVNYRIEHMRDQLEKTDDPNIRGALQELRRFKSLREEAIADSK